MILHKILLFLFLACSSFASDYSFVAAGSSPLNFGNGVLGTTVTVPAVPTTSCATLLANAQTLKLRVLATNWSGGGGPDVTISWNTPTLLVKGADSLPFTLTMNWCLRNTDVVTIVTSPHAWKALNPNHNNANRHWYIGTGSVAIPFLTPIGVYTASIIFTGTY